MIVTDPDPMAGEAIAIRPNLSLQVCHSPGRAPALVFLHGGLGNRYNWRAQYQFAQQQGWEALTYDLAGNGQSSPYRRYSLGRHGRDLARMLKRFQIRRPVLCCHSYGVPLGLEWAQRHPVSGLILICGGTHNLDPWWEVPLMRAMIWGGRHLFHLPGAQRLSRRLTSLHEHEQIEQFFAESPVPTDLHPYRALEIFWGYNFFERQRSIVRDIPALVISGGRDITFTDSMAAELASHFRPSQRLHIPEAGHVVMAEYPELVNRTIASWLAAHTNRHSALQSSHSQ